MDFIWEHPTLILIALGLWSTTCIFLVRGKQAAILETLGKPHPEAYYSGLHFKLWWPFTYIRHSLSLQIEQITEKVSIKTQDNVFIVLPVNVQFRVDDDPKQTTKAFYELERPRDQIVSYVLNNVRKTAASMTMNDLYQNRSKIEDEAKSELAERFERFGYIIENVLIDEPVPPKEVQEAFNQVIASQRARETAENEAEAIRVKLVGTAKAEAESKKLAGEGLANMRKALADGIKTAMDDIKSTGLSPQEAMQFMVETNRLDMISGAAEHGNLIMMDVGRDHGVAQLVAGIKAAGAAAKTTKN